MSQQRVLGGRLRGRRAPACQPGQSMKAWCTNQDSQHPAALLMCPSRQRQQQWWQFEVVAVAAAASSESLITVTGSTASDCTLAGCGSCSEPQTCEQIACCTGKAASSHMCVVRMLWILCHVCLVGCGKSHHAVHLHFTTHTVLELLTWTVHRMRVLVASMDGHSPAIWPRGPPCSITSIHGDGGWALPAD